MLKTGHVEKFENHLSFFYVNDFLFKLFTHI